ncbi:hypothetical protein [Bacteroides sp.]|uniref:hypothetical protein n=1 Tax=Bacteroides sp. TaxID=29523 RepID=UPI00261D3B54|nr:hypothetical protein [Bacteroides sp.]MDD3037134.1 hypothetical protein [Bacteroides sp.]
MEKGKFYSFKMKGWKEPICGVIERIGSEWILIKHIVVDYVFDGYSLIQRKYIKDIIRNNNNIFTEKVLIAKGVMDINVPYDISLNTQTTPFEWLQEHDITAEFYTKDRYICYIGKVIKITKKYFHYTSIDTKGCWDNDIYECTFANIRAISIDTDYTNSLLIYNEKFEK